MTYQTSSVSTLIRDVFGAGEATVAVFHPPPILLEEIITVLFDDRPSGTTEVLTTEDTADHITENFLLATRTKDLIDEGVLNIHIDDHPRESTYLATTERVLVPILIDTVRGVTERDPEVVSILRENFDGIFSTTESIAIRTPGAGRILSTCEQELGADVRTDLERWFGRTAEQHDTDDPVEVVLLVAAKHELLLYDLGRWAEDVGLASKATLSRRKMDLEDRGLLQTDKIPLEVGRPRLRLRLGENAPEDDSNVSLI